MRKTIFILILFVACSALAQPVQINRYEYWFNQLIEDKVVADITPADQTSVQLNLSAASLPDGLNSFTIRFRDSEELWSSALTRFFVKMPQLGGDNGEPREIVAWEYRLNQGEMVQQSVTAAGEISIDEIISAAGLPDGLNSFSVRFKDNTGLWSSLLTRFFVKMPALQDEGEENQIVAYQLWLNNDFAGLQQNPVESGVTFHLTESISAAALPNGLNQVSIRFRDEKGLWSNVITRFFVKNPIPENQEENLMTAYEYWLKDAEGNVFDQNGQDGITYVALQEPVNPMLLDLTFNLRMISHGDYYLMFRFLDTHGNWSSVLAREIEKSLYPWAVFSADETELCGSGTVVFSNFSVDADTWLWDFGDGEQSAEFEPEHIFDGPGIYIVSLTASDHDTGLQHTTTLEINVYPVYEFTEEHQICEGDTFTWQGNEYDTPGTFTVVHVSEHGCDSVYVLNLAVIPLFGEEEHHTICQGDVFSWQGNEYSLPGTYEAIYESIAGCDSIYVLHLTVSQAYEFVQHYSICQGEVLNWQGYDYDTEGTFHAGYQTIHGCDSIFTLHLIVNPSYLFEETATMCQGDTFNWFGQEFTATGTYTHLLQTQFGCDSLYVLELTVLTVDTSVEHQGNALLALAQDAQFQWINCADGSYVEGETSALFTPGQSGDYAVWVSQNDCTALSDCFEVLVSRISESDVFPALSVFPNPARNNLNILFDELQENFSVTIYALSGQKLLYKENLSGNHYTLSLENLPGGVYVLQISYRGFNQVIKVVKE